jgi:hypothetical protein
MANPIKCTSFSYCPRGSVGRVFYGALLFCLLFDCTLLAFHFWYSSLLASRVSDHSVKAKYIEHELGQQEIEDLLNIRANQNSHSFLPHLGSHSNHNNGSNGSNGKQYRELEDDYVYKKHNRQESLQQVVGGSRR